MAFFAITKEKIATVCHHPNADKLDLCTLEGMLFQFVTGKDTYKVGDEVLYFPVDSILPVDVQQLLGVEGKLSGKDRNRIRTVKLRGEISQGIVCPYKDALEKYPELPQVMNNSNISTYLGITKYEPEEQLTKSARLVGLPSFLSKYDIEGADRYPPVLDELRKNDVFITEKLEGSNFSISLDKDQLSVNQRNHSIVEIEGYTHSFWDVVRAFDMEKWLVPLQVDLDTHQITLYGEFIGPGMQGNIYKLNKHEVRFFDIKTNKGWLSAQEFHFWCDKLGIPTVPLLHEGKLDDFLNGKTVQEASNGVSKLRDTKREGIVIKPRRENYSTTLGGRLFIKQRSPEYLAKTGN